MLWGNYPWKLWERGGKRILESTNCCCCSVAQLCLTFCNSMGCSTSGFPVLQIHVSQTLFKFMSIESVMTSNDVILCHLLLLSAIFPSIRVFSNDSALCIRWPKDWSFSFSISPCNEYLGLISFRMDWLDLLAVQGVLKSFLQCHSSKASILWHSALKISILYYSISVLYVHNGII